MMKLDAMDHDILEILQREGRITNAELAKRLGISPPAMLERVKRLENSGVIDRFVAVVSPQKVGVGIIAFVRVSLGAHNLQDFENFRDHIETMDEVLECYQLSGEDDYLLKVALPDMPGYADFAFSKLAPIHGVQSINSSFVLGTIKQDTALPLLAPIKGQS
ncbi:Lrp/AsnC family transcriptional regulator [Pseudodesulfovibrio senegalensis]|jgi:Lrp/AsnC family leucine-responsive transcriptional regulator|uniref:Lrp/AsnC family transcriptional regulator n=1 Tax=Pseudodesulfovibrio senegalensis TaxID=1721087 RepID=A0A6N6N1I8_9BACT|nr:Lrp/AsnC family transcriptional regulator [Pseudodesulfovibrio senegalensis]KAB1438958.1 Lrp/AsnC family transcriptional regulator [Pseudodesulfovibrio senegalensis]